jgi:hypothetical protein
MALREKPADTQVVCKGHASHRRAKRGPCCRRCPAKPGDEQQDLRRVEKIYTGQVAGRLVAMLNTAEMAVANNWHAACIESAKSSAAREKSHADVGRYLFRTRHSCRPSRLHGNCRYCRRYCKNPVRGLSHTTGRQRHIQRIARSTAGLRERKDLRISQHKGALLRTAHRAAKRAEQFAAHPETAGLQVITRLRSRCQVVLAC